MVLVYVLILFFPSFPLGIEVAVGFLALAVPLADAVMREDAPLLVAYVHVRDRLGALELLRLEAALVRPVVFQGLRTAHVTTNWIRILHTHDKPSLQFNFNQN